MIRQIQLYLLIGIFSALWLGLSAIELTIHSSLHPVYALASSFSAAVFGVFMALLLFDLWLWRLRLVPRWMADRPVLDGTWRAELTVVWRDKDGSERDTAFDGHMVVYQRYSTVSMRLMTDTSYSRLIASELTAEKDQSYTFGAVYQATPSLEARRMQDRRIHYGGMILVCQGRLPDMLHGHFWTDEFSRGTIRLTARWSARHFGSFAAAQAA
ncbi:MAG TPA: hypothetical protein VG013_38675, partial [Gemmataceae bacterium]|nr:hypothetical protein [Gemmataceae bacterium]